MECICPTDVLSLPHHCPAVCLRQAGHRCHQMACVPLASWGWEGRDSQWGAPARPGGMRRGKSGRILPQWPSFRVCTGRAPLLLPSGWLSLQTSAILGGHMMPRFVCLGLGGSSILRAAGFRGGSLPTAPLLCDVSTSYCGHLWMDSSFLHVLQSSYALWHIYQLAWLLGRRGANSTPELPSSADIANHPLGGRLSLGGEPLLSTHTFINRAFGGRSFPHHSANMPLRRVQRAKCRDKAIES